MEPLRPLLLVILLLAANAPTTLGDSSADAITLPPLRVGDFARYEGAYAADLTVGAPALLPDASGRRVETAPLVVQRSVAHTFHVSLASGLVERQDSACAVSTDEGCRDYTLAQWTERGLPALWGATLLQGRALRVGDAWSVDAPCYRCRSPTQVAIEAPHAASPLGTDFVANVTLDLRVSDWRFSSARLHMSASSAYPLLVEAAPGSLTRVTSAAGGDVVSIAPGPVAPYPEPLSAVARIHGLPQEGTPTPGNLSWKQARASLSASMLPPSTGNLSYLTYHVYKAEWWIPPTGTYGRTSEDHTWTERWWEAPGVGATIHHRATRELAALGLEQPVVWSSTRSPSTAAQDAPCAEAVAPLWDLARHGEAAGVLRSGFYGLRLDLSCGAPTFHYGGHCPAGTCEQVTMDARTGILQYALVWTGPLPEERDYFLGVSQEIPPPLPSV